MDMLSKPLSSPKRAVLPVAAGWWGTPGQGGRAASVGCFGELSGHGGSGVTRPLSSLTAASPPQLFLC